MPPTNLMCYFPSLRVGQSPEKVKGKQCHAVAREWVTQSLRLASATHVLSSLSGWRLELQQDWVCEDPLLGSLWGSFWLA